MVDRAAKLYWKLPRAIEIRRQAKERDAADKACFADLRKCYNGQAEIVSIDWEQHDKVLAPNAAKGETCRDKAAQICLDWMRWSYEIAAPASTLMIWLAGIGKLDLAKKLDHLGSTAFFDERLERRKKDRRKKSDQLRQQKSRLKKREQAGAGATRNH